MELGKDLSAIMREISPLSSEAKITEKNVRATLDKALADSDNLRQPAFLLRHEDIADDDHPDSGPFQAITDGTEVGQPARKEADAVIYVISTQPGGRGVTHILNHSEPTRTKCGWPFLRTKWHTLTSDPLREPPSKGELDHNPSGGCRPICKLCLG